MTPKTADQRALEVLADGYDLPGPMVIARLPQGRVNITYKVAAGGRQYILQRLHPVFGDDGAVVENTRRVADRLVERGMAAPQVLPGRNGRPYVENDGFWRLAVYLEGAPAGDRTPETAAAAAGFLGRFHRLLAHNAPELTPLPPADYNHEGPFPLVRWRALLQEHQADPEYESTRPLIARGLALAEKLPDPPLKTRSIVHGDPKMDNFLFDADNQPMALIDLDTVRCGAVLWELADGLRSWAAKRRGDVVVGFDPAVHDQATAAYRRAGLTLTEAEWAALPAAVAAVALNLAWRFLADVFKRSYFVWDQEHYPSLAEQNRRRGAGMILMAEELAAR
jgi:Ser/Thr protein kinase RdoA (MazF antagonist)